MNETEPKYFKEFRKHLGIRFDKVDGKFDAISGKFDQIDRRFDLLDKKIESEINGLAIMMKDYFLTKDEARDIFMTKDDFNYEIGEIKRNMMTKEDGKEILAHIGRYEVRAQNTEETLLKDHKPRIVDLEKEVYST